MTSEWQPIRGYPRQSDAWDACSVTVTALVQRCFDGVLFETDAYTDHDHEGDDDYLWVHREYPFPRYTILAWKYKEND